MHEAKNNVAIYVRLSVADQETRVSKNESNSILGQKNYINQFLDCHEELKNYNRIEYVDDGFTGTNDKRPKFQEMIEDVKRGHIKVICTKDTSRFFRDYTEAGNYIECVFPFLNVRYISINDNYDSDKVKGGAGSFELAIRNIVYSSYSRDLSDKTKKAKAHLIQQGKFVAGIPPYGYIMHPTEKHKVIIDPIASKVVRKIFNYALDGLGTVAIAEKLNEEGIITQGKHFGMLYPQYKFFVRTSDSPWRYGTIHKVLTNECYIGTMVSCKRGKENFYGKNKAKEPIKIANAYEPIVTVEEFKQAQQVIKRGNKQKQKEVKIKDPLKGLILCGNCKSTMYYSDYKFVCIQSKKHNCFGKVGKRLSISKEILVNKVIDSIRIFILLTNERAEIGNEKECQTKRNFKNYGYKNSQLFVRKFERERESIMRKKTMLYEQYVDEYFSKDVYLEKKKVLEERFIEIDEMVAELREQAEVVEIVDDVDDEVNVLELCKQYAEFEELTYEMTHSFIDKIYVYADGEVEVKMKFEV